MTTYPNGDIPRDRLVLLDRGTNEDGYWEHLLPPATAARHKALVRLGQERHGKTLRISAGWNGYRPRAAQDVARRRWGNGAAVVGTSSHGGTWAGRVTGWKRVDTAAIDYANWLDVFGSRAAFAAACQEVGLLANQIVPPDWPDEPWHVIDLDPWGAIPAHLSEENELNTDQNNALSEAWENSKRIRQVIENLEAALLGAGQEGQPASTVRKINEIHSRVNFAVRPNGDPYLIAVQGDVDTILGAIANKPTAAVDVADLAARLRGSLGDAVADALGERLVGAKAS